VDLHLEIDREAGHLAAQVSSALREAVRQNSLAAGARLPATRQLADDLGVSRGVIVEAYDQLIAEGFLTAKPGAGTIVTSCAGSSAFWQGEGAPVPQSPVRYQLRPGIPDLSLFPRAHWLKHLRQVLARLPHEALGYPDPGGVPELREELANYLNRARAARAVPQSIVVVNGVALALSLTVRVLAREGRQVVAVEDPSGLGTQELLREAGAELVHVPVDGEGIDVSTLERSGAQVVILTPAHQFPTGVVLSPARRAALAAWARATGAYIVEDDYDAEFRFDRDPVGSLQGLLPGQVILTGSVSKSLSPGLRLGWMVAPPAIAEAVRHLRSVLDLGSPVLEQHTLASFLADGSYDRHLRRVRKVYRRKRDAMAEALTVHLPQSRVRGISAGLHLYAELPEHIDDQALAAAALKDGVSVYPVSPMRTLPGTPGLVLGFASEPEHRIAEAVRLLGSLRL
jgi:GntR family transcriptional regulator/MocR family aminotransferase